MRVVRRICPLFLAFALSSCSGVRPRAGQNVLLVTIDTLRADRLGAYGYRDARTPHLDALASEGVLFEEVLAQAPLTLPSHASLLTGLVPPTHGVRDNTYFRLDSEAVTLAEILKEQGYQTAAFVGAFVLDRSFGLDQGFDVYDDEVGSGGEVPGVIADRKGELVTRAFRSWLERRERQRPFFAWIHFFDPHLPYDHGGYDGEIGYVDEQVGKILEGLPDDTLVVLTSDHGESLGEHGEKSHGFFVYDATLRVPLVLSNERSLPKGQRVEKSARIIDVLPTILSLLDLPSPPGIQGRSLLSLVSGGDEEGAAVYAECYAPRLNFRWAPLVSIRDGNFKYIEAPRPELYDLSSDPGETKNLFDSEPRRAEGMRALLRKQIDGFPNSLSSRMQPDPDTIARLRSLGYAAFGAERAFNGADLPDPKDRLHLWRRLEEVILAMAGGDSEGAREGALDVLEEDPSNLLALELLANARSQSGDRQGALEIWERIASLDESRPLSHLRLGNLRWQSGDLDGAEASFRTAIEKDPRLARAHRRLGELYLARGQAARSLASLRQAAEISGDDIPTGIGLSRALRASGSPGAARAELEKLRQRHPRDPELLAEYAGTLAQLGDADGALTLLAEGPDQYDVHFTRSVLLRSQNRMEEALAELDRAIALRPQSAPALHDRGVILSRMGRLTEAVAALSSALAVQDTPGTRNALGVALCRMGRCSEAIPHFERAVAAAPEFIEALENLAQAYEATGRSAEAGRTRRKLQALKVRR
jgi:arylsulfatase A-like enzyme/Flp pilus assembly protein TadD